MSYVIKADNEGTPLYFYKMCRRVYRQKQTPAFKKDIEDAYVFDSAERAERMKDIIHERHPDLKLEIEKLSLRGPDGYVPLEKTVNGMLSDDFRHRLWAEYEQLNTRRHQLKLYRKELCENGADDFQIQNLNEQVNHMQGYMLDILDRCRLMGIDLEEVEKEIE